MTFGVSSLLTPSQIRTVKREKKRFHSSCDIKKRKHSLVASLTKWNLSSSIALLVVKSTQKSCIVHWVGRSVGCLVAQSYRPSATSRDGLKTRIILLVLELCAIIMQILSQVAAVTTPRIGSVSRIRIARCHAAQSNIHSVHSIWQTTGMHACTHWNNRKWLYWIASPMYNDFVSIRNLKLRARSDFHIRHFIIGTFDGKVLGHVYRLTQTFDKLFAAKVRASGWKLTMTLFTQLINIKRTLWVDADWIFNPCSNGISGGMKGAKNQNCPVH